jgi:hypothetical protein
VQGTFSEVTMDVKVMSHVNDTFGSIVLSTWVGNFAVNLQENQVDLFASATNLLNIL